MFAEGTGVLIKLLVAAYMHQLFVGGSKFKMNVKYSTLDQMSINCKTMVAAHELFGL